MKIPKRFKERYGNLVDDENAFFEILTKRLSKSFRVNTIKAKVKDIVERFECYGIKLNKVPWYNEAFVSENPEIGFTIEHFLGYIYIQELTSMLPPLIIRNELKRAESVLDACAAPGSKATQVSAFMKNRGLLVANDINYRRIKALKFNVEKSGALNTVITNNDLRNFGSMQFDIVLLDVPCSAEGTIRKNPGLFSIWREWKIKMYARLQKQLIVKAFDLLKPNGVLVYSTCTFAPEENEAVIDHLLKNRNAKIEKISLPRMKISHGITKWGAEFDSEIEKTVRIWPHHNNTGGFFLAKVRK